MVNRRKKPGKCVHCGVVLTAMDGHWCPGMDDTGYEWSWKKWMVRALAAEARVEELEEELRCV